MMSHAQGSGYSLTGVAAAGIAMFKSLFGYGTPPQSADDSDAAESQETETENADEQPGDSDLAAARSAYAQRAKRIDKRIRTAKLSDGTIDNALKLAQDLYHDDKIRQAESRLDDIEVQVEAAIAAAELSAERKRADARYNALTTQKYQNKTLLAAIAKAMNGADLSALRGPIASMLTQAEGEIRQFTDGIGNMTDERDILLQDPVLAKSVYAGLNALIDKVTRLAGQSLDKAISNLTDLEAAITKASADDAEARSYRDQYAPLLQTVTQLRQDVPARSGTHKSYNFRKADNSLKFAAEGFAKGDFQLSVIHLEDAQVDLESIDARAYAQIATRRDEDADRAAEQAAEQAARNAAEAQRLARVAAQAARENAMDVASLAAIGKDGQFGKWFAKVKELKDNGIVTLGDTAPYLLPGGNTVEVQINVTPTGGAGAPTGSLFTIIRMQPEPRSETPARRRCTPSQGRAIQRPPAFSSVTALGQYRTVTRRRSARCAGYSPDPVHSAPASLSCAIAAASNSISGAFTSSANCSGLVALAIGAVMLGRAISQANATCAGVARSRAATSSSAARMRRPVSFRCFPAPAPRARPARSVCMRYLPVRNPLASE